MLEPVCCGSMLALSSCGAPRRGESISNKLSRICERTNALALHCPVSGVEMKCDYMVRSVTLTSLMNAA